MKGLALCFLFLLVSLSVISAQQRDALIFETPANMTFTALGNGHITMTTGPGTLHDLAWDGWVIKGDTYHDPSCVRLRREYAQEHALVPNVVFGTPTSEGPPGPVFRALDAADIPATREVSQ